MNVSVPLSDLLNIPFDSFESMSALHLYVRILRHRLRKQHLELSFYRGIEQQLKQYTDKQLCEIEQFFEGEQLMEVPTDYRLWALTITFDPNRFTNIDLTDQNEQVLYIKYILMKTIRKFNIPFLYGSFEHHKNGRMHFHGVIAIYDKKEVEKYLLRKFTDNPKNKHCILWKPVDNINKWLDYINKESLDFISYKMIKKINSLDL